MECVGLGMIIQIEMPFSWSQRCAEETNPPSSVSRTALMNPDESHDTCGSDLFKSLPPSLSLARENVSQTKPDRLTVQRPGPDWMALTKWLARQNWRSPRKFAPTDSVLSLPSPYLGRLSRARLSTQPSALSIPRRHDSITSMRKPIPPLTSK